MFDATYIMYHKVLDYDTMAGSRFGMRICHNRIGQQSALGTCGETGSGIGPVVCKNFVERNGRTLSVDSIQGKGSTFRFTMKQASSPA